MPTVSTSNLTGRTSRSEGRDEMPYALSVRLTTDQRLFLQMVAEANDIKVSTAFRLIIDEAIAQVVEDSKLPDGTRTDLFGIVKDFTPDPAWVIRHGADE